MRRGLHPMRTAVKEERTDTWRSPPSQYGVLARTHGLLRHPPPASSRGKIYMNSSCSTQVAQSSQPQRPVNVTQSATTHMPSRERKNNNKRADAPDGRTRVRVAEGEKEMRHTTLTTRAQREGKRRARRAEEQQRFTSPIFLFCRGVVSRPRLTMSSLHRTEKTTRMMARRVSVR